MPIGVAIEGANRHDMKLVRPTHREHRDRASGADARSSRKGMCLDKGYDYDEVREILRRIRLYGPYSPTWGRSPGHQARSGLQSAAVGGGTSAFVDEPFSPPAGPLGQKAGELSGVSPFCLWLDRFSRRRVTLKKL